MPLFLLFLLQHLFLHFVVHHGFIFLHCMLFTTQHQLMLGFLAAARRFCIVTVHWIVGRELGHDCAARLVGQRALQEQDACHRGSYSGGPQLCTSRICPLVKFEGSYGEECYRHNVAKHNECFCCIRKAVECFDVESRRDADDGAARLRARGGRLVVLAFGTRRGSGRGEVPDWTFRALRLFSEV